MYLHYVTTFFDTSNAGVAISTAIVFQQTELGYSLVSSTIPTLKTFLRRFDTGMGLDLASSITHYGHGSTRYKSNMFNSSKGSGGRYELQERSKDGTGPSSTERLGKIAPPNFRPDLIDSTRSIAHPANRTSASAEQSHTTENSQEMTIRYHVDFQVQSE